MITEYIGGILAATAANPAAAPRSAHRLLASVSAQWGAVLASGQVQCDLLADHLEGPAANGTPRDSVDGSTPFALLVDRRVHELHDEPWGTAELGRMRERLRDLAAYELRLLTGGE
jgi:hypothetical protein